jgi:cytochrome c553
MGIQHPGHDSADRHAAEGIVKAAARRVDAAAIVERESADFPTNIRCAALGERSGIAMACSSCHLMSGQPSGIRRITGIPILIDRWHATSRTRRDEARMGPIARAAPDQDVRQAAEYATLKPTVLSEGDRSATPPRTFTPPPQAVIRLIPTEAPSRSDVHP